MMQKLASLLIIFATFSGCALLVHCQGLYEGTLPVYYGPPPPWYGEEALPPHPLWHTKNFPMLKWFYKHDGNLHNEWKVPSSSDSGFDSKSSEELNFNQQFLTNSPSTNRKLDDKEETAIRLLPEVDTELEETTDEEKPLHHEQKAKLYTYRMLRSVEDNLNSTPSSIVKDLSGEGNENSTEHRHHHRRRKHKWGRRRKHRRRSLIGSHRDSTDTSSTTEDIEEERNETAEITEDGLEIEAPDNTNSSGDRGIPILQLELRREESIETGINNDEGQLLEIYPIRGFMVECKKDKNNNCQSNWK